jgi:hypothetical protein
VRDYSIQIQHRNKKRIIEEDGKGCFTLPHINPPPRNPRHHSVERDAFHIRGRRKRALVFISSHNPGPLPVKLKAGKVTTVPDFRAVTMD